MNDGIDKNFSIRSPSCRYFNILPDSILTFQSFTKNRGFDLDYIIVDGVINLALMKECFMKLFS